jgi:pilus assembly protein Flp/PilA
MWAFDLRRDSADEQRGASATEYGLLVIFIAIAITLGVGLFGAAVNDWFGRLVTSLQGAGVL